MLVLRWIGLLQRGCIARIDRSDNFAQPELGIELMRKASDGRHDQVPKISNS